ncbi:MAG: hypothetical protein J6J23_05310 [Clostridia bacterium]|nr:hypothetical protein [Clostridia bacterium]
MESVTNYELERLIQEVERELCVIDNMQPSPKPQKPNAIIYTFYYNNSLSFFSWVLIICAVAFLLCFISTVIFPFLLAVLIVVGIPLSFCVTYTDYKSAAATYSKDFKEWQEQQKDWEAYIEKQRKLVFDKYQEKASYILSPDSSKPQMNPEEYRSWCRTQEVIANNQKRIDKIMRKYRR